MPNTKRDLRVLVCGSREWTSTAAIYKELNKRQKRIEILIEGDADGADIRAGMWAGFKRMPHLKYPADWDTYGKAAGPIRNREMFKEGRPNLVLAFHEDISKSKGTKDMVNYAKSKGVKTLIFTK